MKKSRKNSIGQFWYILIYGLKRLNSLDAITRLQKFSHWNVYKYKSVICIGPNWLNLPTVWQLFSQFNSFAFRTTPCVHANLSLFGFASSFMDYQDFHRLETWFGSDYLQITLPCTRNECHKIHLAQFIAILFHSIPSYFFFKLTFRCSAFALPPLIRKSLNLFAVCVCQWWDEPPSNFCARSLAQCLCDSIIIDTCVTYSYTDSYIYLRSSIKNRGTPSGGEIKEHFGETCSTCQCKGSECTVVQCRPHNLLSHVFACVTIPRAVIYGHSRIRLFPGDRVDTVFFSTLTRK